MSRILILQSPFSFPRPEALFTELLGIEYLAAALRAAGHVVTVRDFTARVPQVETGGSYYFGPSEEEVRCCLEVIQPEVVGISCHYALSRRHAYRLAELVKDMLPDAKTVMGGLFVSLYRTRPLEECAALDFALMGEAERTFIQLVASLSEPGASLASIEGLIYRDNGIRCNEKKNYIHDLDALPFPARDLVDIQSYMGGCFKTSVYGLGHLPTLSLLTSRSCPYRCSFCNMFQVHGPRWRSRSVDNIVEELDEMVLAYGAKHIFIVDDNFTFDLDRAKEICRRFAQKKYKFRWNTPNGISAKKVDLELAHLMKQAHCANVCIAIESGSEYMRTEVMNKKVSNEEIIHAVNCFKAVGIPVTGFFVVGMPGETEARFNEGLTFARSLNLTTSTASYAIPFPGTALHDRLVREGVIDRSTENQFDDLYTPVFETSDFTRTELIRRRDEMMGLFPNQIILEEIEKQQEPGYWGSGA